MLSIKILVVEDEQETAQFMCEYLQDCNFTVDYAETITDALFMIRKNNYDILLLDLHLSDSTGFELLRKIKSTHRIPTIVVSGEQETTVKIHAFKLGADDYVVKPVDMEELVARIWVLLGKPTRIDLASGQPLFQTKLDKILYKDKILDLTKTERDILLILLENKNITVSRESITNALNNITSHRSLDYHIKNLRKKLSQVEEKGATLLRTEYGVGYKLQY